MSRRERKELEKHKKKSRFGTWFKNLKTWKKVLCIVLPIILILAGSVTAFLLSQLNKIQKESIDPSKLSIVDVDGYTNILMLGVDARDINNLADSRSDAIMVISINDKTNDVKLISIYRDTYLKMGEESVYDKVTHAFARGGPELSVKTINQALDLDIQNYVVFNFKVVADIIDQIGGVEIDVKQEEIYPLNDYAQETAEIIGRKECPEVTHPGKQTLVGVQAVSYGRIRKGVGDDFKRTERMRTVLTIAADKVKTLNASQISDLIDVATPQVKTTLSNSDIISLALNATNYKISGSIGFPYEKDSDMLDGVSYVYPINLASDVKKLHQEAFGQQNYKISDLCKQISDHICAVFGLPTQNNVNNNQNQGNGAQNQGNNQENGQNAQNQNGVYQGQNNTE